MNTTQSYAFIVDGSTLNVVFEKQMAEDFKEICIQCEAVLCCRMTPGQKAQVKINTLAQSNYDNKPKPK